VAFYVRSLDGRVSSLPGASELPCAFSGKGVVDATFWFFEPEQFDEVARISLLIHVGAFTYDSNLGRIWVAMHPREHDSVYAKAIEKHSLIELVFNDDPVAALATLLRKHFVGLPYAEYLQTPHWQEVREAALMAADYRCQVCYSPDKVQVHHRTYDRRGRELPSDVTVLCDTCHGLYHNRMRKDTP
jgi:hypothetical protein